MFHPSVRKLFIKMRPHDGWFKREDSLFHMADSGAASALFDSIAQLKYLGSNTGVVNFLNHVETVTQDQRRDKDCFSSLLVWVTENPKIKSIPHICKFATQLAMRCNGNELGLPPFHSHLIHVCRKVALTFLYFQDGVTRYSYRDETGTLKSPYINRWNRWSEGKADDVNWLLTDVNKDNFAQVISHMDPTKKPFALGSNEATRVKVVKLKSTPDMTVESLVRKPMEATATCGGASCKQGQCVACNCKRLRGYCISTCACEGKCHLPLWNPDGPPTYELGEKQLDPPPSYSTIGQEEGPEVEGGDGDDDEEGEENDMYQNDDVADIESGCDHDQSGSIRQKHPDD